MTTTRLAVLLAVATTACAGDKDGERISLTANPEPLVSNPALSKSGRLAYDKFVAGRNAIFVADAKSRDARRISFGVWDYSPMWSPDEKWVAYESDINGSDVMIAPRDSGAPRAVSTNPTAEAALGWLPDGSGLLYQVNASTGFETWIYRMADGSTEKFLKVDGSAAGYPSPDGKTIGYCLTKGGHRTVWLWDRATNKNRQLTTEGFECTEGKFSPDGAWLLYQSRRTGTSDLWKVHTATGERVQLTQDIAEDFGGRWSPDGGRVLFRSQRGGQFDLWVLSAGEGDVQRVTDDAMAEQSADWTPDGAGIVFQLASSFQHVQALPLDGGPAVQLTSGDWHATWTEVSPDGKSVAYAGTRNGDEDVWVVPATGGESRLVSSAPGYDGIPSWSPDGKSIAFQSQRGGSQDIWRVEADGTQPKQLTNWRDSEFGAAWLRDGKEIVFASNHESSLNDLWAVPAAGGTPRRITRGGIFNGGFWPSPDSKHIAFTGLTPASKGRAVFVVPTAGGTPRQVAPSQTNSPVWSPDSRELAVQRVAGGYAKIEIYNLTGQLLRVLTQPDTVYESVGAWTADGQNLIVWQQDIYGDGGGKHFIMPSAGGPRRRLTTPTGFAVWANSPMQIANDGKHNIVLSFAVTASIFRVPAPAVPVKGTVR